MIIYREATLSDTEKIALLHARSWQLHYRGIWPDAFLDSHVVENRLEVWKERFQNPKSNQHILVAEENDIICGFVCVFAGYDPQWGALLDNLHVIPGQQSKGIGAVLLKSVAGWVYNLNPDEKLHLYVLEKNSRAIQFYDRMGGTQVKLLSLENPDGSFSEAYLYVWADLKNLCT